MEEAQQEQQCIYNQPAQTREFQPGEQVQLLVPKPENKFLASWQDPYTIREQVGPVNYLVEQPGCRCTQQVYHVNLDLVRSSKPRSTSVSSRTFSSLSWEAPN